MTLQWLRQCRLQYQGVTITEDMRIRFKVSSATSQSLNHAQITVSNLSAATADKFLQNPEGKTVTLIAGYNGNAAPIFVGHVVQVRKGRENPTDTIVIIDAYEGDVPYNRGVVNKALPAGSTPRDHYDTFVGAMSEYGIQPGYGPDWFSTVLKYPRAQAFFGMARDHLRRLSHAHGCTWTISRGRVDMVPTDQALPGGAVVLNAQTGMIGMPTQTQQAIIVTALINPAIQINGSIKLNNDSIQRAQASVQFPNDQGLLSKATMPNLPKDGLYKVLQAEWEGDTRGGPWYVTCTCLALNGPSGTLGSEVDLQFGAANAGLKPGQKPVTSTNPIKGSDGSTTHLGED
jgi:hypothetical protein